MVFCSVQQCPSLRLLGLMAIIRSRIGLGEPNYLVAALMQDVR